MGWKIDYQKLFDYLKKKYQIERAFYFGGVEMHKFYYNYLKNETVPVEELEKYLADLVKEEDNFNKAIILSGDGDFLPVLKYLKNQGKEMIILSRGPRTAREIRQFAGSNFRDFEYLKYILKMEEK